MNALAELGEQLTLESGGEAASTGLVSGSVDSSKNVVAFPATALRPQDVVLQGLLKGMSFDEIASLTHLAPAQVRLIARSEWITRELGKQAQDEEGDTIRNLLRVYAFDAVQELAQLVKSPDPKLRLNAIRTVLEWSLTPARAKDFGRKKPAAADPDAIRAELAAVEAEIEQRKQRPATI